VSALHCGPALEGSGWTDFSVPDVSLRSGRSGGGGIDGTLTRDGRNFRGNKPATIVSPEPEINGLRSDARGTLSGTGRVPVIPTAVMKVRPERAAGVPISSESSGIPPPADLCRVGRQPYDCANSTS